MQNKLTSLTAAQQKALLHALIQRYVKDPRAIETALPEVAEILAHGTGARTARVEYGRMFQLTPVEKDRRQRSLRQALEKMKGRQSLSKAEAIEALEDAAALVEAFPFEHLELSGKDISTLVKISMGLTVTTRGKPQSAVLRDGEPSREVYLLRGVRLRLSWDKKLLSVEIDPRQMAIAAKALSFMGAGPKGVTDLSARHDEYFVEAINAP